MNNRILNYQEISRFKDDVVDSRYGMAIFEKHIWGKINKFIKETDTLLDVGCGTGRHSKFFSNHCSIVTAIDCAPVNNLKEGYDLRLIKNIQNVKYLNKDFMFFDPKEKFDVVFSHGSFYYFHESYGDQSFSKMTSFLKKNNESHLILVEGLTNRKYNLQKLCENDTMKIIESFDVKQWGDTGAKVSIIKSK